MEEDVAILSPENEDRIEFLLSTFPKNVDHTIQHPSPATRDAYFTKLMRRIETAQRDKAVREEEKLRSKKEKFKEYERYVFNNLLDLPLRDRIARLAPPRAWFTPRRLSMVAPEAGGRRRKKRRRTRKRR